MKQEELQEVYKMVDTVPFSRPKKNISRDFSDGVMLAQLLYFYNPKLISLHNYPPANATHKKIQNWNTLNAKVLKKIDLSITKQQIQQITNCIPGVIEQLLYQIFLKFQRPEEQGNLIKNAKGMDSRAINRTPGGQWEIQSPKQQKNMPTSGRPPAAIDMNSQAQEIIKLVQKIDEATQKLHTVREQCKLKDQIIFNLQKKLQKVIFS